MNSLPILDESNIDEEEVNLCRRTLSCHIGAFLAAKRAVLAEEPREELLWAPLEASLEAAVVSSCVAAVRGGGAAAFAVQTQSSGTGWGLYMHDDDDDEDEDEDDGLYGGG